MPMTAHEELWMDAHEDGCSSSRAPTPTWAHRSALERRAGLGPCDFAGALEIHPDCLITVFLVVQEVAVAREGRLPGRPYVGTLVEGACPAKDGNEGRVVTVLVKKDGLAVLVVARLSYRELCTSIRRNIRADMDYEDVRDGLGLLLLDSRVAWSHELELVCTSLRTMGFEPVMEAIDGSMDEGLSYDDDEMMREFSLRSGLYLVLDSGYIRQKGIVDMGPEP